MVVFALIFGPAFVLSATVTYTSLESRSQNEVCGIYKTLYEKTVSNCAPTVTGCTDAKQSDEDITATINRINFYRYLTGEDRVVKSPSAAVWNGMTKSCTLLKAFGGLSHGVPESTACFDKAANEYLGKSNVYFSSRPACSTDSIDSYIDDARTASVGHRRWIHSPYYNEVATCVNGQFSALYVQSENNSASVPAVIAYPNPGFFPIPKLGMPINWTFSANNDKTKSYSMPSDCTASVNCDGKNVNVKTHVLSGNKFIYPHSVVIDFTTRIPAPTKCSVTITSKSADTIWKYDVKPVDCAGFVPKPDPVTPKPAPVTPKPAPVTPKPDPVTPKPAPVTPKPDPKTPEPAPITPVESENNFCIGTKEECGNVNPIASNEVGNKIVSTAAKDIELKLFSQKISLPIATIVKKNIVFNGNKPDSSDVTITGSNVNSAVDETKHHFSQLSLSFDGSNVKFNEVRFRKTIFKKMAQITSKVISGDLDSLLSLFNFQTSRITVKSLQINSAYPMVINFSSSRTIVIKRVNKIKATEEFTLNDDSEDVSIKSTQPITLNADNNQPGAIKKLKLDLSEAVGDDKKLIFAGNWANYPDISSSLSVEVGDGKLQKEGNSIPVFNETQEKSTKGSTKKLSGGAVAGIVIGVLVAVAIAVGLIVYFVVIKGNKDHSTSN